MHHQRHIFGFTLLEVLFVMVIIGIFSAVIVPRVQPLVDSLQLRGAVSSIKYQLMMAKTRSLGDSRIHCGVFFDTGSTPQSTQIFFDNTKLGSQGFYDPGTDTRYMEPYVLPMTIRLTIGGAGTNQSIVFRGDGSTTVHGMQLTIQTKTNRRKSISVLPSTGRIQVTNP